MAASGQQIPEAGELRLEQLEIGKVYRVALFGRRVSYNGTPLVPGEPHQVIYQFLGEFNGVKPVAGPKFTIVAAGTMPKNEFSNAEYVSSINSPTNNFYYRFFQTAQDRIVTPFKQQALEQVFNPTKRAREEGLPHVRFGVDPATAHGFSDGWFEPNKKRRTKTGGRKYKTRQTKIRRQNTTKKNRRRTHN
jgi:hypothetical protein